MSENKPVENNRLFFDRAQPMIELDDTQLSELTVTEAIPQRAVVMRVTRHAAGFSKTLSSSSVMEEDNGIDPSMVTTSISLVDKKYLTGIKDCIKDLGKVIRQVRLPLNSDFLGVGAYLIPMAAIPYADGKIKEIQTRHAEEVEKFCDVYDDAKNDAKERSPTTFSEADYASRVTLREQFAITYRFHNVTGLSMNEQISSQVFEEQHSAFTQEMKDAMKECGAALRVEFANLVDNMADKLTGMGDQKKVFKTGFVENWRSFLETFDAKNLANDKELKDLVEQAKGLLDGTNPDVLRNNLEVQSRVTAGIQKINDQLDGMIENRGRKMRLMKEDDE